MTIQEVARLVQGEFVVLSDWEVYLDGRPVSGPIPAGTFFTANYEPFAKNNCQVCCRAGISGRVVQWTLSWHHFSVLLDSGKFKRDS